MLGAGDIKPPSTWSCPQVLSALSCWWQKREVGSSYPKVFSLLGLPTGSPGQQCRILPKPRGRCPSAVFPGRMKAPLHVPKPLARASFLRFPSPVPYVHSSWERVQPASKSTPTSSLAPAGPHLGHLSSGWRGSQPAQCPTPQRGAGEGHSRSCRSLPEPQGRRARARAHTRMCTRRGRGGRRDPRRPQAPFPHLTQHLWSLLSAL